MKKISLFVLFLFLILPVFSQESESEQKPVYTAAQKRLRVTSNDIRLVPETELPSKGYHLYIRKRPEIESVLLTETTKDPEGKNDSFAYRAREYNSINGDEIRYLDGKPLISEWAKYSLVDSSPEEYPPFGLAFHIYIPEELDFGYEWERHGSVKIGKGTFINIRTFEKPYADYSGDYMDSPFMFDLQTRTKKKNPVTQKEPVKDKKEPNPKKEVVLPELPPENPPVEDIVILNDDYNPVASDKFQEIAEKMFYSKGPDNLTEDIMKCLNDIDVNKSCDLVFVIDATGSMKNDIEKLKSELVPSLIERFSDFKDIRYGLLLYRDYADNYKYRDLPVKMFDFTDNRELFNKNLGTVVIKGKEGGDVPEAVYEALYAASSFYAYRPDSFRKTILIGDAEPHPKPRGTKKS